MSIATLTRMRTARTAPIATPRATVTYRPIPATMARASFPLRGTCDTCARTNVPCTPRRVGNYVLGSTARTMVCAHCTMTGA